MKMTFPDRSGMSLAGLKGMIAVLLSLVAGGYPGLIDIEEEYGD